METIDLLRSGQLQGIKRLDLAADLTDFPIEIFDLADSLEILNLSDNHLRSLPADLGRLHKLKIIFLSNNNFEEVPPVLADCPNLSMVGFKSNKIRVFGENSLPASVRWSILTDNQLEKLPNSIGRLQSLQKLMLAGNQLRSLPDELAACQNLELIRLAANRLESLPSWLFSLPRLSWLAYAGNPCCGANRSPTVIPSIPWADLTLSDTLGEGASGIISQGVWQSSSQPPTAVAIKIFKGAMTSDGKPADEMNACLAAGGHPHLVGALGRIGDCPNNRSGLVMSLIPSEYQNLGNPPSLDSCTRDTYADGTSFTVAAILRVAIGICAAAAHLHAQGIMHGDLYAHNILIGTGHHTLLGDFGAASSYDLDDEIVSVALERLEVRAFGCLLEDLLDRARVIEDRAEKLALAKLDKLRQDCLQPMPSARPLFSEIDRILGEITVSCQT
jgi:Protein tyrosine and serine/threonine kinase/Leucine rich repeat